ncbi:MAG: ROK family protein, partial [Spirochaetaceae bacterium]|nr:ROK family protein [Spirochaetaceae bacterium]
KSISFEITELFPFTQIASVQAGVPVFIENDARCCCYSERTLMHDMGQQNSLFILIEMRKKSGKLIESNQVSVGAGLVINGKIFKGTEFSAGEFRSMLWTSGQHRQFQAEKENLEDFGAVLPDGGKTEDSIFNELAKHVAFLTNTLNLETVYIGGLESELEEKLVALFKKRIELQWPYGSNHEVDVRLSSLGNLAVAYGAAGMFLDRFFALPSLSTPSGSGPSILESLSQVCETGHAGKLI